MAARTSSVELLVDLFLEGNLEEEGTSDFSAEGCIEGHDGPQPYGGVDVHDGTVDDSEDQEFVIKKCGRDLKAMGDDMNKEYRNITHKSLQDEVKKVFEDPELEDEKGDSTRWFSFRDLMDRAVKDIGQDDSTKVLAAVLVSIKGLHMLGSSVKNYALRYIGERKLDEDIKKLDNMKNPQVD